MLLIELVGAERRRSALDGGGDHLVKIPRPGGVGRQAEEDVADQFVGGGLHPAAAITKLGDRRHDVVQRRPAFAPGVNAETLTGLVTELEFGKRQAVAVEEIGDLLRRRQCFLLGAALIDGLSA